MANKRARKERMRKGDRRLIVVAVVALILMVAIFVIADLA